MHMQVDRIKCMGFRIYTPPLDAKSQNFICHVPLSYVQGTIQDQGWQSLFLHLNLYVHFSLFPLLFNALAGIKHIWNIFNWLGKYLLHQDYLQGLS